ncbi:MAG: ImmA/IrrE family metallo-endopeptidase, partial [Chloroflexota bacterium]|nr:ImmA/IrrE family metallo-endopeptidase [Chloroflexota bacterium]
CEMSAGLGWDPYDLDDDSQGQVIALSEQLGDLREEAVPVIDSADPSKDCATILAAFEAAKPNLLMMDDKLPSFIPLQPTAGPPWEAGYRLAREARSEFGLDGLPIPDTESLASALNQSLATLRRATEPVAALGDLQLVDGVVTRGASGGISLGLKARGETGMRFLFCRALCEAISSHQDSLVTRGTTQRQQRNRAFAAEFLAPAQSLRERITHPIVDAEQVDDIAEEFGVSTQVILNQIENHRIAQVAAI